MSLVGGGTDVAVSTLVSVRDRVIQSYEDIMKMPI
jgi:flagellar hook-basal body complex protein FliE